MQDELNPSASAAPHVPAAAELDLDALRAEQSLASAWIGGAVAAVIGAGIWAAITVITEFQIGWMAVGVGALVGVTLRHLGKGIDPVYGFIGAAWALFGCALGNLLTVCAFIAAEQGIPLSAILSSLTFGMAAELMTLTFSPIDLLFYGLAVHAGYRLAFRELPGAAGTA